MKMQLKRSECPWFVSRFMNHYYDDAMQTMFAHYIKFKYMISMIIKCEWKTLCANTNFKVTTFEIITLNNKENKTSTNI